MGVVVGGTDPLEPPSPPGSGHVRLPRGLALIPAAAALVALGFVLFPAAPGPAPGGGLEAITELDTGRWIPVGHGTLDPFDARRLADRYLFVVTGGIASIDIDGVTTVASVDGNPHRITSTGNLAVAHGTDPHGRPTIWTSTDGARWSAEVMPWQGSVLAVAVRPDGLIVLGIDQRRQREIVARTHGRGWAVTAADIPNTGLWSTGTGIVGRDRLDDGTVGYLHTANGIDWEPIGSHLSLHWGDVATIHDDGGTTVLRVADSGLVVRPPETPVSSLWILGERIWLQTPSAAWWSTDGMRWSPMPIDRARGVDRGAPVLLPFTDRAILSVGGARGVAREIYMWILGA